MNIAMLSDWILVKLGDDVDINPHGRIITPDVAKNAPQTAKVIACGPGHEDYPTDEVFEGDEIVFPRYATTEVELEGETYHILRARDILAIVERGPVSGE